MSQLLLHTCIYTFATDRYNKDRTIQINAIRITQNILHFCPIGFTHFSDLPKVLLPKYTERYTESR